MWRLNDCVKGLERNKEKNYVISFAVSMIKHVYDGEMNETLRKPQTLADLDVNGNLISFDCAPSKRLDQSQFPS